MLQDFLDQIAGNTTTATGAFAPTATGPNLATASFNYLDRIFPMDDGAGYIINFVVQIATTVTSGGAATVDFQLLGNATDPTFTSGNVVVASTRPQVLATLVAGTRYSIPIPRNFWAEYEKSTVPVRYYTLNVQIATAVLTAGAFNSWLQPNTDGQDNLAYPAGYSV